MTAVSLTSPHQVFILITSVLSFILILILLITTLNPRNASRIPRHPVITTLLVTALPRILVLLMPFLVEHTLKRDMPYHMKDRTVLQQESPLAKFCVFQGLAATYLLATHAAFIVSFTLSLLHILRHPQSHVRNNTTPFLPSSSVSPSLFQSSTSSPRSRRTKFITRCLCLFPLLYALPIPILGLILVFTIPTSKKIIYFQGTYCSLDIYSFQFTSAFMTGLPLIVSLGILGWGVWGVVRFYAENAFFAVAAAENTRFAATRNIQSVNTMRKKTMKMRRKMPLHFPPLSIILRLSLLVFEIFVTTVLYLLEVSLFDSQLAVVLKIDRYWEAIVPLLEFLIFASQSAVLQSWFPGFFARRQQRMCEKEPDTPNLDSLDLGWVSVDMADTEGGLNLDQDGGMEKNMVVIDQDESSEKEKSTKPNPHHHHYHHRPRSLPLPTRIQPHLSLKLPSPFPPSLDAELDLQLRSTSNSNSLVLASCHTHNTPMPHMMRTSYCSIGSSSTQTSISPSPALREYTSQSPLRPCGSPSPRSSISDQVREVEFMGTDSEPYLDMGEEDEASEENEMEVEIEPPLRTPHHPAIPTFLRPTHFSVSQSQLLASPQSTSGQSASHRLPER